MGLLLAALPWTAFWEHNYFAQTMPWLRAVLTNNFARGAVTGLGLINLYVGLVDLAYLVGGAAQMRAERKDKTGHGVNEERGT
jgi:hypothetical protein